MNELNARDLQDVDVIQKETSDTLYHMLLLSTAITKKALLIEAEDNTQLVDTIQNVAIDKLRRNLGL